jgi:peptide/nickel transport system permease protein
MRLPFQRRRRDVSAAERYATATQLQLTWWRFRRHRLAMVSLVVLILAYSVALMADFLATTDPHATDARTSYIAPQPIHWFDADGSFRPYVYGLKGVRDIRTFKLIYTLDTSRKVYLQLLAHNYTWSFMGIRSDLHLLGLKDARQGDGIYLLGTDQLGRDLWSRLMVATRVSLFIGLVGVSISLFLGVVLGGTSAIYGGWVDLLIQRMIEVVRSMPTIPLWLGLSAALPSSWSVTQIYFSITIIISMLSWTDLARVVRGKFLSLKEDDFVLAAELAGASQGRIIFRHMLPSFASHIIAAVTLALPAMIISETSLSFLGLGLRPPAISWGVLLQDSQNIQTLVLAPWLLSAAVPVILVILAFNFLGDGLRDAADPYG